MIFIADLIACSTCFGHHTTLSSTPYRQLQNQGMYSLLLTHVPVHHFRNRTISTQPTNRDTYTTDTNNPQKKLPRTPTHSPHDTPHAP